MTIRKTLTNIVLTGTLASGGLDCTANEEYNFDGKIGEKQVVFYSQYNGFKIRNILTVKNADGSFITYTDFNNDLVLDYVKSRDKENKQVIFYKSSKNPAVLKVMEIAQAQFDYYLKQILEQNTAPLNKEYQEGENQSSE